MKIISRIILNTVFVVTFMASSDVISSDDNYMKMLEAEAEDSRLDPGVTTKNDNIIQVGAVDNGERIWLGECDYVSDLLPVDLVDAEFSSYLKQCVMASFTFYQRLEPSEKSLIYEHYKNSALQDLTALRKDILKYF